MADAIPIPAQRFIADHITSVAQLELLLLVRIDAARCWSAEDLSRELRVETAWAGEQLRAMVGKGLLHEPPASPGTYCYRPRTPELEQAVSAVAQAYLLHRVTVIERIYAKPADRIRVFADAFKLRKEPPNG